jgi:hypothetical protein
VPNPDRAVVDPRKVRDYLLSHEHPVGRFKAVISLPSLELTGPFLKMTGLHDRKYEVPAILTGPAGRELSVLTVWLVRRVEDFPRFTPPDALDVEFVRASGQTQALVTLPEDAVRPVQDDDLIAVRRVPPTTRGTA